MARIRTIKPEIASHEELFDLERETGLPIRFAWCMLFTVADREGRFSWRPRTLKAQILPHDDVEFSRVLDAWVTRGFVVKYRVGHAWFGWIPTFTKHQVINNREASSDLPPVEGAEEIIDNSNKNMDASGTREARVDDASGTREVHALGEGRKERKGKERKEEEPPPDLDFDPKTVLGLDLEAWTRWVEHRNAIKKPIRPHSMRDAAEELATLGDRQMAEVKRARAGGWQGLHPEGKKGERGSSKAPVQAKVFPS